MQTVVNMVILTNELNLGGTEKAASLWAGYLAQADHRVTYLSLADGPRRADLDKRNIPTSIISDPCRAEVVSEAIQDADVIHAHAPGFAHRGDVLGAALKLLRHKIPVVQTNIFGQLRNPAENEWTNFRLFISWTSCVQAARRAGRKLDLEFFRRQSVAVYPMEDPITVTLKAETLKHEGRQLRNALGIQLNHVLFGRFSRPEPNKWTPLILDAFLAAYRKNPNIRLLLREPPPPSHKNSSPPASRLGHKIFSFQHLSFSAFQFFFYPPPPIPKNS
ncbi:MAG: glycosyltransferase family 4 protein [Blastochloris sp.]|nr:glycosyltransferase family 4 protein [Blastochloris sp.]